jgi:hypothetical protein
MFPIEIRYYYTRQFNKPFVFGIVLEARVVQAIGSVVAEYKIEDRTPGSIPSTDKYLSLRHLVHTSSGPTQP